MEDQKTLDTEIDIYEKIAIVIGVQQYNLIPETTVNPSHEEEKKELLSDLSMTINNANAIKEFFEEYKDYKVFPYIQEKDKPIYAKDINKKFLEILQKARNNQSLNRYTHFFIYYTGHGGTAADSGLMCGIDSQHDLILVEQYVLELSLFKNNLTIAFMDCCANRLNYCDNDANHRTKYLGTSHEYLGISILFQSAFPSQQKLEDGIAHLTEYTKKLRDHLVGYRQSGYDAKKLVERIGGGKRIFSIPTYLWGVWNIFSFTQSINTAQDKILEKLYNQSEEDTSKSSNVLSQRLSSEDYDNNCQIYDFEIQDLSKVKEEILNTFKEHSRMLSFLQSSSYANSHMNDEIEQLETINTTFKPKVEPSIVNQSNKLPLQQGRNIFVLYEGSIFIAGDRNHIDQYNLNDFSHCSNKLYLKNRHDQEIKDVIVNCLHIIEGYIYASITIKMKNNQNAPFTNAVKAIHINQQDLTDYYFQSYQKVMKMLELKKLKGNQLLLAERYGQIQIINYYDVKKELASYNIDQHSQCKQDILDIQEASIPCQNGIILALMTINSFRTLKISDRYQIDQLQEFKFNEHNDLAKLGALTSFIQVNKDHFAFCLHSSQEIHIYNYNQNTVVNDGPKLNLPNDKPRLVKPLNNNISVLKSRCIQFAAIDYSEKYNHQKKYFLLKDESGISLMNLDEYPQNVKIKKVIECLAIGMSSENQVMDFYFSEFSDPHDFVESAQTLRIITIENNSYGNQQLIDIQMAVPHEFMFQDY